MRSQRLEQMVKGWFVGAFEPNALKTDAAEVAVKSYPAGASERAHYHKVATEVTLIVSGRVRMFDREWGANDIIIVEPGDITAFEALTDVTTVVVKVPGALDDKYEM